MTEQPRYSEGAGPEVSSRRFGRIALVHDWLTGMRGGEYVLEAIAELYPTAELFTLIHVPGTETAKLARLPLHTTWLQHLPSAARYYRHFLPLMPRAIESFDMTGFDLIISSSHCVAKGVRKRPSAVHISYVHAPMRYVWDRFDDYFGADKASPLVRVAAHAIRPYLRSWDRRVSQADRVDVLIANSQFIAAQIKASYGRSASVLHPFVDLERFSLPRVVSNKYLMVGAFAPNKRVDIAIDAFNRMKLPLQIVGKGQDEARLKAMAGPTIEFLGPLRNEEIAKLYAQAKAFVFPGLEDFGITPLEAMASGCPVVAYGRGGACETVVDRQTGILFAPQTAEALKEAILRIESGEVTWDEHIVRRRARAFSKEVFQQAFARHVEDAWQKSRAPG